MLFDFSQAAGRAAERTRGLTQHSSIRYMPRWGEGIGGSGGGRREECERNSFSQLHFSSAFSSSSSSRQQVSV